MTYLGLDQIFSAIINVRTKTIKLMLEITRLIKSNYFYITWILIWDDGSSQLVLI